MSDTTHKPFIPKSLAECDQMVKAATAAEMVWELAEHGREQTATVEEWKEYNNFIEAAVHLVVAAIPHFIRPANICVDAVIASDHYRRTGIFRRPDPAEREAATGEVLDLSDYDDLSVVDFTQPSVEKMRQIMAIFEDEDEEGKWGSC